MTEHPYEVYAVDPNNDDVLLDWAHDLDEAREIRARYLIAYYGSGCRVEVWRDGEPVVIGSQEKED